MEPCFPWRLDRVQGEKEGRPRDLHPGIDSVVTSWKRPSGVYFLPVPSEWNQFLGPEDRNHNSVLSGLQAGNRMRQRCAEQSRGWGDAPEGMGWGQPDLKLSPLWGSLTMNELHREGRSLRDRRHSEGCWDVFLCFSQELLALNLSVCGLSDLS